MSARRLTAGFVWAILALVAAGCSSSGSTPSGPATPPAATRTPMSAAAYRGALHQIATEEATAQHKVQRAFSARTATQVRSALRGFASDQHKVSAELTALIPPPNAASANAALARAFSDNSQATTEALRRTSSATSAKQALAIIQRDRAAQKAGREIDAALARLKKLGYTSGS